MNQYEKMTYNGQDILLFNYIGLRGEQLLERIKANTRRIIQAERNAFLVLSDFTNTYATDDIMEYLQSDEGQAAAAKTTKAAVVGVTGIKKVLLNAYNQVAHAQTRAFPDIESAKEYLVS